MAHIPRMTNVIQVAKMMRLIVSMISLSSGLRVTMGLLSGIHATHQALLRIITSSHNPGFTESSVSWQIGSNNPGFNGSTVTNAP